MKYDTSEKKIRFLKKKGNIITFKETFYPRGNHEDGRKQIIVMRLQTTKAGVVKIIGAYYDSNLYNSLNDLLDSIDWEWMEWAHAF